MPAVTLKAHFNGKQIVLHEPFDLPSDSPLMVTVLPKGDSAEVAQWHGLAAAALARAYGENEPDYSAAEVTARCVGYATVAQVSNLPYRRLPSRLDCCKPSGFGNPRHSRLGSLRYSALSSIPATWQ